MTIALAAVAVALLLVVALSLLAALVAHWLLRPVRRWTIAQTGKVKAAAALVERLMVEERGSR